MAKCEKTDCGYAGIDATPEGLYGTGNDRPAAHETAGATAAAGIVRRDAAGTPDPAGKVGFLGLGMSNAELTWNDFAGRVSADSRRAQGLVLVEGCEWGADLERLTEEGTTYWTGNVANAILARRLTSMQIGAVWIMEALKAQPSAYPQHVDEQVAMWTTVLQTVATRFPNCKIAYLDGPQYMGYAQPPTAPQEPFYGQSCEAIREVIRRQVDGELGYEVGVIPWLSWGGYFWSNGPTPNFRGFSWNCPADCRTDGIHQSLVGAAKMGTHLRDVLFADPTTLGWMRSS